MLLVGSLMIEHRLIEKMINIIDQKTEHFKQNNEVDSNFINIAIDFIRTYADRCHHGKEEDILFRELAKKDLKPEDQKIMAELITEHKQGRAVVAKLEAANKLYQNSKHKDATEIITQMQILVNFYPKHIDKEDKQFFLPVMDYFSDQEKDDMLKEGFDFDQKLIHDKYSTIVGELLK